MERESYRDVCLFWFLVSSRSSVSNAFQFCDFEQDIVFSISIQHSAPSTSCRLSNKINESHDEDEDEESVRVRIIARIEVKTMMSRMLVWVKNS